MLVITRKKDEELIIGDNIKLKIVSIENGSVKIALDAPKEITIFRKELYEEVIKENLKATKVNMVALKGVKGKNR